MEVESRGFACPMPSSRRSRFSGKMRSRLCIYTNARARAHTHTHTEKKHSHSEDTSGCVCVGVFLCVLACVCAHACKELVCVYVCVCVRARMQRSCRSDFEVPCFFMEARILDCNADGSGPPFVSPLSLSLSHDMHNVHSDLN